MSVIMRVLAPASAIVLLLAGCGPAVDNSEAGYLSRAAAHEKNSQYSVAIIELKNAVGKYPSSVAPRLALAKLYLQGGYGTEAEATLRPVFSAAPDAVKPSLGRALLAQGKYAVLLKEITVSANTSKKFASEINVLRANAMWEMRRAKEACQLFASVTEADPSSGSAWRGLAGCYSDRKDYQKARSLLESGIKADPRDAYNYASLGNVLQLVDDEKSALFAYAKAIELEPNLLDARFRQFLILQSQGKIIEARSEVDYIKKINPKFPFLGYMKGLVSFHDGQYKTALSNIDETLKLLPDHFPSILMAGICQFHLQQYEQSAARLARVVAIRPSSDALRSLYALVNAAAGNSADARKILQEMSAKKFGGLDNSILAMLGSANYLVGDYHSASSQLQGFVDVNPDNDSVRISLARSLAAENRAADAIRVLSAISSKSSKYLDAQAILIEQFIVLGQFDNAQKSLNSWSEYDTTSVLPIYYQGLLAIARKNNDQARASFRAVIKVRPDMVDAYLKLAALDAAEKKYDSVRTLLSLAIKNNPTALQPYIALYDLENKQSRPKQALAVLEQAARSLPSHPVPAALLGRHYLDTNPEKTIQITSAASLANPNNPVLLDLRAQAFFKKGDSADGIAVLRQLVKAAPDHPKAKIQLANALLGAELLSEASAVIDQELLSSPNSREALHLKAALEVRSGRMDAAVAVARKVQQLHPNDFPSQFLLYQTLVMRDGVSAEVMKWIINAESKATQLADYEKLVNAYSYLGEVDKAKYVAKRAVKIAQVDLASLNSIAKICMAAGDMECVFQSIRLLAEKGEAIAQNSYRLGVAYMQAGNWAAAETALKKSVAADSRSVKAYSMLTKVYLHQEKSAELHQLAKQASGIFPELSLSLNMDGHAFLLEKKYQEAVRAFEGAYRKQADVTNIWLQYQALHSAGQESAGVDKLQQFVAANPQEVNGRLYLASALKRAGRRKQALDQYGWLSANAAANPRVLNEVALAYQEYGVTGYMTIAEKAVRLAPGDASVLDSYAVMLMNKGEQKRALPILQKAVAIAGNSLPVVRLHLAEAYAKQGDKISAKSEIDFLIKLFPSSDEASAARKLLKEI